jgi:hypothetical protein
VDGVGRAKGASRVARGTCLLGVALGSSFCRLRWCGSSGSEGWPSRRLRVGLRLGAPSRSWLRSSLSLRSAARKPNGSPGESGAARVVSFDVGVEKMGLDANADGGRWSNSSYTSNVGFSESGASGWAGEVERARKAEEGLCLSLTSSM